MADKLPSFLTEQLQDTSLLAPKPRSVHKTHEVYKAKWWKDKTEMTGIETTEPKDMQDIRYKKS